MERTEETKNRLNPSICHHCDDVWVRANVWPTKDGTRCVQCHNYCHFACVQESGVCWKCFKDEFRHFFRNFDFANFGSEKLEQCEALFAMQDLYIEERKKMIKLFLSGKDPDGHEKCLELPPEQLECKNHKVREELGELQSTHQPKLNLDSTVVIENSHIEVPEGSNSLVSFESDLKLKHHVDSAKPSPKPPWIVHKPTVFTELISVDSTELRLYDMSQVPKSNDITSGEWKEESENLLVTSESSIVASTQTIVHRRRVANANRKTTKSFNVMRANSHRVSRAAVISKNDIILLLDGEKGVDMRSKGASTTRVRPLRWPPPMHIDHFTQIAERLSIDDHIIMSSLIDNMDNSKGHANSGQMKKSKNSSGRFIIAHRRRFTLEQYFWYSSP